MKVKITALFFATSTLFINSVVFGQGDDTESAFEEQTTIEAQAPAPIQAAPANTTTSAPSTPPAATTTAPSNNQNLQPAGQVVWVSGTVKASYPEQTSRILTRGSMIYEKDKITTDAAGSGQLSFTDNSMVTLNPDSIFIIEEYYFNQEKPQQGGQSIMNLVKGGLRAVTGFVAKSAPANYQMKTPVATIGVRGTDYQASCPTNPGQCAFGLLHGRAITLTNASGTAEVTPELPYASVASFTTKAILSKTPSSTLGKPPTISPANAPAPSGKGGGGNCGILIN